MLEARLVRTARAPRGWRSAPGPRAAQASHAATKPRKTNEKLWFLHGFGGLRAVAPCGPVSSDACSGRPRVHGTCSAVHGAEMQKCAFALASDPPPPFCRHPAPVKLAERSSSVSFWVSDWRHSPSFGASPLPTYVCSKRLTGKLVTPPYPPRDPAVVGLGVKRGQGRSAGPLQFEEAPLPTCDRLYVGPPTTPRTPVPTTATDWETRWPRRRDVVAMSIMPVGAAELR